MHDVNELSSNLENYKKNLKNRGVSSEDLDKIHELNLNRKNRVTELEEKRHKIKELSKEIGLAKKSGANADQLMQEVSNNKSILVQLETKLGELEEEIRGLILLVPNLTADDIPYGEGEDDNVEVLKWGTPKTFSFPVKDHIDIGEDLGLLDFKSSSKMTGARFSVYTGPLARLERALVNFMLDRHEENGQKEVVAPYIVHEKSLVGSGQLPKFKGDLFKIEGRDWYLIPTSEVTLVNLHREEILKEETLPLKYCSFSPCFRSEAGSYGKDTKGLIRQHQFHKVEMVQLVHPDKSDEALEEMVKQACDILEDLKLPYRKVLLCSKDMGFSAMKTFDLEVWLPGQNKYREISSLSNCGAFQSRRASIRFKGSSRPQYAHTLNGSGLAIGRTLLAIMENYQREDGTIEVPEVLQSYMGGKKSIS